MFWIAELFIILARGWTMLWTTRPRLFFIAISSVKIQKLLESNFLVFSQILDWNVAAKYFSFKPLLQLKGARGEEETMFLGMIFFHFFVFYFFCYFLFLYFFRELTGKELVEHYAELIIKPLISLSEIISSFLFRKFMLC